MVQEELRDLELQMAKAQKIANKSKQDQVIYKSIDSLRYEIYVTTPKEGFAGNAFRTIRFTGEDKSETVLRDTENIEPATVSKEPGTGKAKTRKGDS